MNQTSQFRETLLVPRAGQWVVLARPGHFSKTDFAAGHVKRVTGMSIHYQNSPIGKDVHRLATVWAICGSEREAREKAAAMRDLQVVYRDAIAAATEGFWAAARELGMNDRKAAAEQVNDR